MVLTVPFSTAFWICYLGGGVSDLLDGPIARGLHIQSAAGAKLDSAADFAFAAAITVVAIRCISLPKWLWACGGCLGAVRLVGYGIGFVKYRTFSALHTYANKATGALLFAFPLFYAALGLTATGIVLCAAALFSSAEELAITVSTPALSRDCKGIYQMKRHEKIKHEQA
ncbi:MAG: CDP-alcohol phosphatidyltransferase family protein [Clostridiales bacterium]|nr:CDP-alcohol phosphatidyltransferase family protein [Clostridiales bacterium]